jgi:plastocyanin
MLKFLSLSLLIISSIILYFNASTISGELGTTPNPTHNKLLPTYVIDITTGSGISYKFQHFYPLNIAIPIGTTVAWFNDDPEQIHTVTSSAAGDSNSGKLFNSGIIPYSSSFQYTFDQPGIVSYHCEIHPWMIGSVYASDSHKQGKNFKLSTGTPMGVDDTSQNDWLFNTTKIDRILFNVQPTSLQTDKNTSLTYNISIYNNQLKKEVFLQSFFAKGNALQLELLASDLDEPLVYGPDFSDPIIGSYHIRDNFPNGDYILKVEITAIGSNLTPTKISDEFKGTIYS